MRPALDLIAEHVEKQHMVSRNDNLWALVGLHEHLRQVIRHSNRVVFVQRRNWIINVDVLHPAVRLGTIEHELHDGEEEAPDEDILLTTRDLYRNRFAVLVTIAEEHHRRRKSSLHFIRGSYWRPAVVVNVKTEVGVSV